MIPLSLLVAVSITPPDTVYLSDLQQAALRTDPRYGQIELNELITSLRLRNLETDHLPDLSLGGQATYQSEVTSFPGGGAPGFEPPSVSKDQYQLTVNVDQVLYDGGAVALRRALEEANLDVQRQSVRVDLYALHDRINQAFFGALLAGAREVSLETLEQDVRTRIQTVEAGIAAGAVLPGVADELRTELLRIEQQQLEARTARRAALDVLGDLTGRSFEENVILALPDVAAGDLPDAVGRRPEFGLFEQRRDLLDVQRELASVKLRPKIGAFVLAGYGRPGFDFFNDSLHPFWQGGVRVRWTFWDWNTVRRDREVLELQERILDTQEAAFERSLRVGARQYVNDIRRLEEVLAMDDAIIEARERIAERAARQLQLGVITAADYLEKRNAAVQARLAKEAHRIELAQARILYVTLLGNDLP